MSDIREALSAAFDEEEVKAEAAEQDSTLLVEDPPAVEVEIAAEDPPAVEAPVIEAEAPADGGAQTDEEPPVEDPVVDTPAAKPPGSWTPAAREHWAKLPADVQREVVKRERETQQALTHSTEARKFQAEFSRTMQPYLGFIAAENSNPLQAVDLMMKTAAALRVGTPQQKVQVVAQTIKNFGIDLAALDAVLAGQQPRYDPQTLIQQQVQQAVAPYVQQQRQAQAYAQQQSQHAISAELDAFAADPKNEFYNDVAPLMADIMELSEKQGQQVGLSEAYGRAILIHEPVRRVIEARKTREAATAASLAAKKARGAAASVTPSIEMQPAQRQAGNNLRADIEAAFANTSGR